MKKDGDNTVTASNNNNDSTAQSQSAATHSAAPSSSLASSSISRISTELRSTLQQSAEDWQALSKMEKRLAPDEKMRQEMLLLLDHLEKQLDSF